TEKRARWGVCPRRLRTTLVSRLLSSFQGRVFGVDPLAWNSRMVAFPIPGCWHDPEPTAPGSSYECPGEQHTRIPHTEYQPLFDRKRSRREPLVYRTRRMWQRAQ